MQPTNYNRSRQSVAGSILIVLGIFIFCANLDRAVAEFLYVLGAVPHQAFGVLPALVVGAARLAQAYASNRQWLFHILVLHTLASVWPLLLVAVGAILSRDSVAN